KAVANIKNHGYSIGTYTSHIYITGENGVVTCLIAGNCEVTPADIEIAMSDITANGKEKDYRVEAQNIGVYGGLGMEVAVWGNSEGGQNDLRWYKGYMGNEGQWYADIDISNHKERGLYYADVYVIMHNGARMCVKSFQMNITSPMADVSIGAYDKASGTFELTASNIQCPSGVKKIEFPVWKEGDQAATVYWYTAKKQADGTYKAVANIKNHGYSIGTYTSHIYITGENGVVTCLIAGNCEVNSTLSDGLYTIMGNAGISVNQMSSYFRSLDVTYPSLALKKGGAASIEEFCQIVYEEAVSEGVKAEVVFAQIMLETGNLQFGNDVKIEQFNFGGLGATGNGNPGCSFPDVRTGIRANVQHLKCYASNEPLNNEKVDPRWGEWLRNKAPYVQWLSIPHNPYGTGWAADEKYGESILNIINRLYN
ncbi:GBS Bsp-like repeat-containing protein, partial [Lachnoclostridium sp. An118]|uniref:GBS Bsp-like repeat-containing protein n=1 Tax=Lachnoclostridium sp. An118 TaxID=1965547 RepID=UPI000B565FF2